MDVKVKRKLEGFFSQYKLAKYKKGEMLVRADDPPSGIFYLKKGVVRRYAISLAGEELTLNIYRPISFFPVEWAINDTVSHHYYEAMTPVITWRAPKEDVLEFIKKENDVIFDLLSRLYTGLQGFFLRMEYLMAGNARARLVTELLILANRFGKQKGAGIVIGVKLSQKDLAAQSGLARETVNRELALLKEKRLVIFAKGRLIIRDLGKLEEELVSI